MAHLTRILAPSALPECGRLRGARVWAYLVAGTLLVFVVGSFFVPWTQNVSGEGRVIAYSPVERETPYPHNESGHFPYTWDQEIFEPLTLNRSQ